MKICAIICEYNPFHSGHEYQLRKIKNQFDNLICIMSGNFVQRAEPSIVEKTVRAKTALLSGASMVIELPTVYATANGEKFADGAVKTLSIFSDISALAMGCESKNEELLFAIAKIQSEENQNFKNVLNHHLNNGLSYAQAITLATTNEAHKQGFSIDECTTTLHQPNNLLCIAYIKALKKYLPNIKPILIPRVGNEYNNLSHLGDYLSASAIRNILLSEDGESATPYLPNSEVIFQEIKNHLADYDLFQKLCLLNLRMKTEQEIALTPDCGEGIEYKLKENSYKATNLYELLENCKSKRYTLSRLKRICLHSLLGINKNIISTNNFIPPRLLAINENFKHYLTENGKNMIIRSSDLERFNNTFYSEYFTIENRSAQIYSLLSNKPDNLFVPSKLITI